MKSIEEIESYLKENHGNGIDAWITEGVASVLPPPGYKGAMVTDERIIEVMRDYLSFAYNKAYSGRAISANRSIMHYIGWTWLIDDEFSKQIEKEFENNYCEYGVPILNMIADHYNFERELPPSDDWLT